MFSINCDSRVVQSVCVFRAILCFVERELNGVLLFADVSLFGDLVSIFE